MIGSLTYDQVQLIADTLEQSAKTVDTITKNLNIEELQDFVSTVESYSKYLKTTIQMNKDADTALEGLKNNQ